MTNSPLAKTLAIFVQEVRTVLTSQQIKVVDQQIEELRSELLYLEYHRCELLGDISKLTTNKE